MEGEIYWETEPSSGPWGVILAVLSQQWMFKNAKYKNLGENLYNKKKLAV